MIDRLIDLGQSIKLATRFTCRGLGAKARNFFLTFPFLPAAWLAINNACDGAKGNKA
jgi:hypothetical protein